MDFKTGKEIEMQRHILFFLSCIFHQRKKHVTLVNYHNGCFTAFIRSSHTARLNFFSLCINGFENGRRIWSLYSLLFLTFHQRIKHFDSLVELSMLEPHIICRFGLQSNLISHLEEKKEHKLNLAMKTLQRGDIIARKSQSWKAQSRFILWLMLIGEEVNLFHLNCLPKKVFFFRNFKIWKLIENPQLKVWQGLDSVASIALQVFGRQTICSAFFQIRATKNFERENISRKCSHHNSWCKTLGKRPWFLGGSEKLWVTRNNF